MTYLSTFLTLEKTSWLATLPQKNQRAARTKLGIAERESALIPLPGNIATRNLIAITRVAAISLIRSVGSAKELVWSGSKSRGKFQSSTQVQCQLPAADLTKPN